MAPKRRTLAVPALAGAEAWRPTGAVGVRTVANWALKHKRFISTDADGEVVVEPQNFPDEYRFPAWEPYDYDKRFGDFSGPPVIFEWRRFWPLVPGADTMPEPTLCQAAPLGTPAAQPWVPGQDWGLVFAWDPLVAQAGPTAAGVPMPALAGGAASSSAQEAEQEAEPAPAGRLVIAHPTADGKPVKAVTTATQAERQAAADAASSRLRDRLAARYPGSGLRGSQGYPAGSQNKRPAPLAGGGLVGGATLDTALPPPPPEAPAPRLVAALPPPPGIFRAPADMPAAPADMPAATPVPTPAAEVPQGGVRVEPVPALAGGVGMEPVPALAGGAEVGAPAAKGSGKQGKGGTKSRSYRSADETGSQWTWRWGGWWGSS